MKKKFFNRPICILISEGMFQNIKEITDQREISISDYVREQLAISLSAQEADNQKHSCIKE